MTPEEFKSQLDKLRTVMTDGIAYFSAWRKLMIEDEDSAQALNRYRAFFLPARNALNWMALLQLAKVFDRHRGTVSLRNLLTAAKKDRAHLTPDATEEDLNQIEQQIDANEALLKRLWRVRSELIAHTAIKPGYTSVRYGEFQRLIEDVKESYNSLRRGHDRTHTAFNFLSGEAERHTSEVVRIMREERDRGVRRIRKANRILTAEVPLPE